MTSASEVHLFPTRNYEQQGMRRVRQNRPICTPMHGANMLGGGEPRKHRNTEEYKQRERIEYSGSVLEICAENKSLGRVLCFCC